MISPPIALLVMTLGAVGQSPTPAPQPAPFAACPSPRPAFAALAIDAAPPIEVLTTQQFVVALRTASDGGYGWRLLNAPAKASIVRADGTRTMNDIAFGNLDRPGQPPQVGGNATELWLFTALAPGTAALNFGLMAPGSDTPTRTTTYTVRIAPNVMVC